MLCYMRDLGRFAGLPNSGWQIEVRSADTKSRENQWNQNNTMGTCPRIVQGGPYAEIACVGFA